MGHKFIGPSAKEDCPTPVEEDRTGWRLYRPSHGLCVKIVVCFETNVLTPFNELCWNRHGL